MAKKRESALHKKLGEELVSLIGELDEAGLAFLVEQARVHLYNMEVERLEGRAMDVDVAGTVSRQVADGSGKSKAKGKAAGQQAGTGGFRVERSSSGSTYHIISGGKWKMFNEAEMLAIVKICQSRDPLLEVTERLYRWFDAERPDTFQDLELGDHHDPRMKELVQFLRKKFAVRQ